MLRHTEFTAQLQRFYSTERRAMPWREAAPDGSFSPYNILVSEIMLQQTQVSRVIPKYQNFLVKFPTVHSLATAQLSDVLAEWVGLGYNRRARYLHEAARTLAGKQRPWEHDDLVACKGIGPNTAAAVLAYAYDAPVLFVETNIRTVIIHHFFQGKQGVTDKEILEKMATVAPWQHPPPSTLNPSPLYLSPRQFYWAMMDYGSHLKATVGNLNRHSKSYVRQSAFEGSRRQIRGRVISLLAERPRTLEELRLDIIDTRLEGVLESLRNEHLVGFQDNMLMLYNEA